MAIRSACMHKVLSQALGLRAPGSNGSICLRAFSAASQPTGRTGSGSATNVSGQRDQEAAADEGAPPPDSAFDAGGAAGTAMKGEKDKDGAVNSRHTQNFDQEQGQKGGKAGTGPATKSRSYSTFAARPMHAVAGLCFQGGSRRTFGSLETFEIEKEQAMSDKQVLKTATGGAALEDKVPDEDSKEGRSKRKEEREKAEHSDDGKPLGQQTGSGSSTHATGGPEK